MNRDLIKPRQRYKIEFNHPDKKRNSIDIVEIIKIGICVEVLNIENEIGGKKMEF